MKTLILIGLFVVSALAAPRSGYEELELAKKCDKELCQLPNCRCSSAGIPGGLNAKDVPQLVLLTFDDAVNIANINYYEEIFDGKVNPDGCPIAGTFFVSQEYTDYSSIHSLSSKGHEIALHSITHQTPTGYWRNLSVEGHMKEFADQRVLMSNLAKIPKKSIQGIRLPFLQLSGNNSFEMIKKADLKYDASWPTSKFLWPYTLDYKTTQECPIGPCPTASIPGVWVSPMTYWKDDLDVWCSMVDACVNIPDDVDGLLSFMIRNFESHYLDNRSPFGFYLHAAWFGRNENHFTAYLKFIDYLQKFKDVYLVSLQRALEWVQNPSKLDNLKNSWPNCQPRHKYTCEKHTCEIRKGEEYRYMTICGTEDDCPEKYPWVFPEDP
ncbi:hypothetical protein ILUMI_06083 [Ignelater luminosus]|uniref:NodB homology domain-containing protein n=1 Tax=Ignelater luminosus TaxID=2038154 RepID=A0A8K0GFR2_IGNLU|nr:hypothetical protein ILUMI_06083 [Ignelater luminosus]